MFNKVSNWKQTVNRNVEEPIYIGDRQVKDLKLRRTLYNKDEYRREEILDLEDLREESDLNQWIEVIGLHDSEMVQDICEIYNIHPLTIEDILNMSQNPKLEEYDDYIFINTKNIIETGDQEEEFKTEQISFILMEGKIISFKECDTPIFDPVIRKLRANSPIRAYGIDTLLYSLLDSLVDDYFIILDELSERIDDVEDELLDNPEKGLLHEIYNLKRTLIYMRKILWPMRNILNKLSKDDYYNISHKTIYYFRDIYDHIIQMIDIVETYRDICSGMLDTYLSSIGNKTNDIMKVLTIFSTISVPLTFLTGIYGMNFSYQPELQFRYGYLVFWLVSIVITGIMLKYFRDRDWI